LPSNVTVESAGDGHGKTIGLLQVASSCICPFLDCCDHSGQW